MIKKLYSNSGAGHSEILTVVLYGSWVDVRVFDHIPPQFENLYFKWLKSCYIVTREPVSRSLWRLSCMVLGWMCGDSIHGPLAGGLGFCCLVSHALTVAPLRNPTTTPICFSIIRCLPHASNRINNSIYGSWRVFETRIFPLYPYKT